MTADLCEREWVLLARRGRLRDSERRMLEDHLKSCEFCRMSHTLGAAFDEPTDTLSGDDQRLERMLRTAELWLEQPRSLSRPKRTGWSRYAMLLMAAIAITASAAAAAVAIRAHSEVAPLEAQHSPTTVVSSLPRAPRDQASRQATAPFGADSSRQSEAGQSEAGQSEAGQSPPPAVDVRAPEESHAAAVPAPESLPSHGKRSTPSTPSATLPTAEQLLRDAGLARRNGQLSEAGRLYQTLQQLYPASRESGLSRVTYGSLLLEQGRVATALEQFNHYLALGTHQGLAAEALYGKARALAALGRTSDERAAWLVLLKEFPKSPYSAQARKRTAQVE